MAGDPTALMDGTYFVSRVECLSWLNKELRDAGCAMPELTKVEQCCTAYPYIILAKRTFPKLAGIAARAKEKPATEYDRLHNWKLLQDVLYKAGLTRILDIEKLAKANYQINLEFVQWFKRIVESRKASGAAGSVSGSATATRSPTLGAVLPADSTAAAAMDPVDLERRYYYDKLLQIERLLNAEVPAAGLPAESDSPDGATPPSAGSAEELASRIRHILYKP